MTETVQDYETLEQEITESRLRWSPAAATSLGRHEWDEELGERSPEAMEARSRAVADQIRRLEGIDADALPEPYRTRHPIHVKKLRFELSEEEDFEASRHSPGAPLGVAGFACNGLMIRDFAPAAARLKLLSSRLRRVPELLQQHRLLYQSSTPIQVDTALQQAAGIIALFERDLPAFAREAGDSAGHAAFNQVLAGALEATRSYASWLENEVRPNANAPIAWGPERMERLVRWQECVDLDLDEIVRRGEADLRAQQARLKVVAAQIDPAASIQDVVSAVGKDHPAAAELLPFTETTLEQLRQFCIDRGLIDMPT
ncbi:MAG: DUF885 family protein, partial [Dehalococcoidia bacterium]